MRWTVTLVPALLVTMFEVSNNIEARGQEDHGEPTTPDIGLHQATASSTGAEKLHVRRQLASSRDHPGSTSLHLSARSSPALSPVVTDSTT